MNWKFILEGVVVAAIVAGFGAAFHFQGRFAELETSFENLQERVTVQGTKEGARGQAGPPGPKGDPGAPGESPDISELVAAVISHPDFLKAQNANRNGELSATGKSNANEEDAPSLRLEKRVFFGGETMRIRYVSLGTFAKSAYIAIVPSDIPHGLEKDIDAHNRGYKMLQGRLRGVVELVAPPQEGTYDARMVTTDSNGAEAASVSFTVRNGR